MSDPRGSAEVDHGLDSVPSDVVGGPSTTLEGSPAGSCKDTCGEPPQCLPIARCPPTVPSGPSNESPLSLRSGVAALLTLIRCFPGQTPSHQFRVALVYE
uniref:Uncharacterized protein n=1 Tax=uncultured prokaryote TaxID=198431 RepID=A0A0H5Q3E8_9ZZZZ|nr:hypothetical protein [uncultured prokaryote]